MSVQNKDFTRDGEKFVEILGAVATNCGEFRDMKIVKYAKNVGTMIGSDGHLHR